MFSLLLFDLVVELIVNYCVCGDLDRRESGWAWQFVGGDPSRGGDWGERTEQFVEASRADLLFPELSVDGTQLGEPGTPQAPFLCSEDIYFTQGESDVSWNFFVWF